MAKKYIGYAERPLNGEVRVKIAYREEGVFGREEFKLAQATGLQNAMRADFFAKGIDLDEITAIEAERAAARGQQQ
jgi:hypothetical protein